MDEIDLEIVRLLHANGRLNQERIAREVKLSRPAVHERIRRLEEEGAHLARPGDLHSWQRRRH